VTLPIWPQHAGALHLRSGLERVGGELGAFLFELVAELGTFGFQSRVVAGPLGCNVAVETRLFVLQRGLGGNVPGSLVDRLALRDGEGGPFGGDVSHPSVHEYKYDDYEGD